MSGFSKQPHVRSKSLIIEDDGKVEDQDNANPFSFKEFVKSKNRPAVNTGDGDAAFPKEPFFKDPTVDEDLLDIEDEDWSGSYHPSVIERTHSARAPSSPLSNVSDVTYVYSDCELSGVEKFATWHSTDSNGQRPSPLAESRPGAETGPVATSDSIEDLHFNTLQMHCEELQEENSHLKIKICELVALHETQTEKVQHLERKLEEKILEEQKEAQDLESMVQQVEKNLQMMTKRAAKAENNVTRLKQEVALLQIQLCTFRAENEALRRGETASMNAVKQNANAALENLHKVAQRAQSSVKQLVSGAETLNLVAELLRSIDKIAEVHEGDVP
ncbi:endosome-associated-trafficking regulator 1 isoform X2 [Ascaphus truei]|uniref:endosome-associated-trafficking regulator 1 isoform X2 n=1 Tax=Ascaphus truei TaxID=8439 RepID=UPI003F5A3B7A